MIRPLLAGVFLGLTLAIPARADALDDDLAAAKSQLIAGNVEEASARLDALEARARTATASSPADAHAQYIMGMAAMYAGRDRPARTALDTALRLEPKNTRYAMGGAEFALYTDAPKEAVTALQGVVALDSKNLELLEMYGQALQAAGTYVEAQAAFQKALDVSPREPRYLAKIAECFVSLHEEDKALATYQKALDINPKYVLALANIGQIHQLRGHWDKAIDAYTRVVALNSADYLAIAKLVQLNEAAGKLKERDAARAQIFALHAGGKLSAENFCREQFTAGGRQVLVFESLELKDPWAVRYAFNIVKADGKTIDMRISLGSYAQTTAIARETGQIKQNERMFHLDVYTDDAHKTLGMFTKEPAYEQTRDMVRQYLAGTLKPVSSTTIGTQPASPAATQGGAR